MKSIMNVLKRKAVRLTVFGIFLSLLSVFFIACSDGSSGGDKDGGASGDSVVCTYYMKDYNSVYYVFYGDGSVEYYSKGELQYKRGVLRYKGNPKSEGTVDITVNTGTLLVTFKVSYVNEVLVPTVELVPGFPVEYTLTLDGENDNSENSGTDKENTEGSGENGNGENDNTENVNTCKWVLDADHSIYFIFYPDNTVEYYSYDSLEYGRSTLNYEGTPTEAGTVTIKVNTGVPLFTFTVTKNGSSVTATENNMGLTYTMAGDSSNNGESGNDENGGTETPEEPSTNIDESPLMFMGFDNVVTIEKGTDITGITNTIYSLTSDTTLKFKGRINSITLTTIAAAMGTNDSVKIALDFSEVTGITEWTNKLTGQKTLYAISLPGTVTSVQDGAFTGCTNLKAITVPCNITAYPSTPSSTIVNFVGTLEDWLKSSVIIPGSQQLYLNGEEVSGEVSVPDGITTIRSGAFSNCPNLTKVVLPESVTNIESYAFANCGEATAASWDDYSYVSLSFTCGAQSLESINLENVTNIGAYAFAKCNSLREIHLSQIESVGGFAFYECSALTNVTINGCSYGETSIGNYAFYNCNALESINLENITSIGEYAFYGCSGLTSVTLPVIRNCKIGDYTFYKCSSLTSIQIPDIIMSIGESAFANCTGLREVIFEEESAEVIANHNGRMSLSCSKNLFVDCPLETVHIGRTLVYDTTDASYSPFYNKTTLTNAEFGNNVSVLESALFYNCINLTSIELPDSVNYIGNHAFYGCIGLTHIELPDSVNYIGSHAFYGCIGLTHIKLPDSVNIGSHAFYGCIELESITMPTNISAYLTSDSSYWFYGCTKLTNITIPDGLTRIGEYAFYGCSKLNNIAIPNSVTYFADFAFAKCSEIASFTIPGSVGEIGKSVFDGCTAIRAVILSELIGDSIYTWPDDLFSDCPLETVYIGRNLAYIDGSPFRNHTTLTSVEIGNRVTGIEPYEFYGCTGITSIIVPDSINYVGEYAFYNCSSLTSITIPNNVESIGQYAFYGCSKLMSLTIPNSVHYIYNYAFNGCSSLKELIIEDGDSGFSVFGYHTYSSNAIGKGLFYDCPLETVYIGRNCQDYSDVHKGYSPFYFMDTMSSLKIGDNVTYLSEYMFYGCNSLTSVSIPESVTTIGGHAFDNCIWLANITLPSNLATISSYAFYRCERLSTVNYRGTESQWQEISIDSNNTELTAATIVYNYTGE